MPEVRVSICGMSKLLVSFVTGVLDADPEIEIIRDDFTSQANAKGAQVLLVADDAMSELQPFGAAWQSGAVLGIVSLSADCREARIVRLQAQNWRIDDVDKLTLSEAIRYAANSVAGNA